MPFCLAQVPNCNDPSKFSERQVYANSVDPDQTPVPSGFTMFATLSASFWLIMSKMIPIKNGGCSFSYIRIWGKLEESRRDKGVFLQIRKQRRSNREAEQRLCFRNMVRTIHLLPKFEVSSLFPSSVAEQPGLCWTWSEAPKTGFLMTSRHVKSNGSPVSLTEKWTVFRKTDF